MASLNMFLAPATAISSSTTTSSNITTTSIATTRARRVETFATGKGSGKISTTTEEKGLFEWLVGALEKADGLLETDPILQKVEGKSGSTVITGKKPPSGAPPPPKKSTGGNGGFGGLGGLFAKK